MAKTTAHSHRYDILPPSPLFASPRVRCTTRTHVYHCTNKHCRAYHEECPSALSPADVRKATGRAFTCLACGTVLRWLRSEERKS